MFLRRLIGNLNCLKITSYPNTSKNPFITLLFHQLLPNLSENIQSGGFPKKNRAQLVQLLYPRKINSIEYPQYHEDGLSRLKTHIGAFLFTGLFYMLHQDKQIRSQSFLFVKRIFELFTDSDTFNTEEYFSNFYGDIFSNMSTQLENAIIELSCKAAEVFAGESLSFLFEAVRCSRCTAVEIILVPSQKWIMQVILPWCHLVKLDKVDTDSFHGELLRYFLDMAFFDGQYIEKISDCWTSVCKNEEVGGMNGMIFTDAMVYVSGLVADISRPQCIHLVAHLVQNSVDTVKVLVYHVSPSALPWNQELLDSTPYGRYSPSQRPSKSLIKEYTTKLCSDLEISIPEGINDYTISTKSAGLLIAELLVQEFSLMIPCIAPILTYVFLHMPLYFTQEEDFPPSHILKSLIEGFIGFLYSSNSLDLDVFSASKEQIAEFMEWIAVGAKIDFRIQKS
jgi:hypothetical protein